MKFDYTNMIRKKLLKEMKDGEFSERERLPRELELAEYFGISRTHLREALAQLEREGFITRVHGIGTFINRHVMEVKSRMDIEIEFLDMIRMNGYQPEVSKLELVEEAATKEIAQKLRIPEGTDILKVCRVCTADGTPAIYCEDIFQKQLVKEEYSIKDFELPIFHFLNKCCYLEPYMDLTKLHAVLADGRLSKELNIPEGAPLLNMEEVDYDISGNILFYSRQYFVDEFFDQTVLRKKI